MQKISMLYDASQAVLSTFELDEVLQQILTIARDYFHLQNVAILLRDKDELYVRCQVGWDDGHDQGPAADRNRNHRGSRSAEAPDLCRGRHQGRALHPVGKEHTL